MDGVKIEGKQTLPSFAKLGVMLGPGISRKFEKLAKNIDQFLNEKLGLWNKNCIGASGRLKTSRSSLHKGPRKMNLSETENKIKEVPTLIDFVL